MLSHWECCCLVCEGLSYRYVESAVVGISLYMHVTSCTVPGHRSPANKPMGVAVVFMLFICVPVYGKGRGLNGCLFS